MKPLQMKFFLDCDLYEIKIFFYFMQLGHIVSQTYFIRYSAFYHPFLIVYKGREKFWLSSFLSV